MLSPFLLILGFIFLAGLILFLFYPIFVFIPRPKRGWLPFWVILLLGSFSLGVASILVDTRHRSVADALSAGLGGLLVIPLLLGSLFGLCYWLYRLLRLFGFVPKSKTVEMKSLAQRAWLIRSRLRKLPRIVWVVLLISFAAIATAYIIFNLPRQGRYRYMRNGLYLDTRTGEVFRDVDMIKQPSRQ